MGGLVPSIKAMNMHSTPSPNSIPKEALQCCEQLMVQVRLGLWITYGVTYDGGCAIVDFSLWFWFLGSCPWILKLTHNSVLRDLSWQGFGTLRVAEGKLLL